MADVCVFCRIIAGEEPAQHVEKWPDAIAIVPLNPVTPGHVLVIPKVHTPNYMWDPIVTAVAMARAAELADRKQIIPSNLITSAGAEATQSVFHLHIHIVPRKANDGLALPWYSGRSGPSGRVLSIDHAKVPGHFKFQVVEGQQFGRAAIIAAADAEAAAWSILAAVYGNN